MSANKSTSMASLKNILKGKSVIMTGGGRTRGQPYTDAERRLAFEIALGSLLAVKKIVSHKDQTKISSRVINALGAVASEMGDDIQLPTLMRGAYRLIEKENLDDPKTKESFPRLKDGTRALRDYTSMHVLFRSVLIEIGVSDEEREEMFRDYNTKPE